MLYVTIIIVYLIIPGLAADQNTTRPKILDTFLLHDIIECFFAKKPSFLWLL